MSWPAKQPDPEAVLTELCRAIAQDLSQLAMLHDRELDAACIADLLQADLPASLGLCLQSDMASEAASVLHAALVDLGQDPDEAAVDELAADYADIYLNYTLQASPFESVWLDEDGLAMQQPMFQVREWYRRYDMVVENWRRRADDYLGYQLAFLAHLFTACGKTPDDELPVNVLQDAAAFMDEHLLRWLFEFAQRVAHRCATPFYAGLAMLTAAYAEELRELLVDILGQPRPGPELIQARMRTRVSVAVEPPAPYVPGVDPSW
jgi:TorA maturation chaperone TorD